MMIFIDDRWAFLLCIFSNRSVRHETFFFLLLAPKEKRNKKEKGALCPAERWGKGLALRCYPSALLGDMALVFLPIIYQVIELQYMVVATCFNGRHVDHIYGIKKAPSWVRRDHSNVALLFPDIWVDALQRRGHARQKNKAAWDYAAFRFVGIQCTK